MRIQFTADVTPSEIIEIVDKFNPILHDGIISGAHNPCRTVPDEKWKGKKAKINSRYSKEEVVSLHYGDFTEFEKPRLVLEETQNTIMLDKCQYLLPKVVFELVKE